MPAGPRFAAVALALLAATPARAFDPSRLEFERSVENVTAPGLYRVEVDPELYRHARRAGLGDVRIAGPDNVEVPWLLRPVPAAQTPEARAVTIIARTEGADGALAVVLDFGAGAVKHSQVTLAIDAGGDWSRQARVEASGDGAQWTTLADGAYLFRVTAGGHVAQRTALDYPTSSARYLRVTLAPSPAAPPVRISGATAALVPPEAHAPLRLLPSVKPQPLPESGEARANAWTIDLGAAGVPIAELALDVADATFARRALIAATDRPPAWRPLAATLLYRVAAAVGGRLAQENVRVPAERARTRWLRLTVYDGDDAPLALRTVSPAYAAEELLFRAPAAGAYTLFVGGDLPAPQYGLAAELARTGEQPQLVASLGTVTPNPAYGHLARPPSPAAASSSDGPRRLWIGLALGLVAGALALALALATRRRLRRARSSGG